MTFHRTPDRRTRKMGSAFPLPPHKKGRSHLLRPEGLYFGLAHSLHWKGQDALAVLDPVGAFVLGKVFGECARPV